MKRDDVRRWMVVGVAVGLLAACSADDGPEDDAGGAVVEDAGEVESAPDVEADAAQDTGLRDVEPAGPGRFEFFPGQVVFEDVEQGAVRSQRVVLKNVGESPLLVSNLRLVEQADGREQGELRPGERWISDAREIAPNFGEAIDIELAPTDFAADRGYLELTVLAEGSTQHVLPIESVNAYADISAPKTLRLGDAAPGEAVSSQLTLFNRGIDTLTVDSVSIEGSEAFRYEVKVGSSVPAALERDEFVALDVIFEPEDDQPQGAVLSVASTDPDEPTFEVALLGNEPAPCIQVAPRSVNMGITRAGEAMRQTLTILNCSEGRALEVTDVSFSTSANGVFEVELDEGLPWSLAPRQVEEVDLLASSPDAGEFVGVLTIRSSDDAQSPMIIDTRAEFRAP